MLHRITDWLETHWVAPSFSGWLMGCLAIFFFGAATNTMAGWLYVMSGVMMALLVIAGLLPERMLRGMRVQRSPIVPVSAGDSLQVELLLENQTKATKTLMQAEDVLPNALGQSMQVAIELIPAHEPYRWLYQIPAERRGVYHWQSVRLKTAAPLGLFWCRRDWQAKATAIVYPTVLPLSQCPLIDQMGQTINQAVPSLYQSHAATEGLTRTLRPYRWGDSIRLVHWRTSARYGELRVRELETFTGGQELVICLDTAASWEEEWFEQAVIAAASLYFYALRQQLQVSLWTATTGVVKGDRAVLETLAATQFGEAGKPDRLPDRPVLWLSQNPNSLTALPKFSRWLLWQTGQEGRSIPLPHDKPGLVMQPDQILQSQLQTSMSVKGNRG